MSAESETAASGELSDTQLDAVAGGSLLNTLRATKRNGGHVGEY